MSIADFFALTIAEATELLRDDARLPEGSRQAARSILAALCDIGLGYLTLGQPSPTLSGGEAQRVKLARYLGKRSLAGQMLVLDEPSTGLHPHDLAGLLTVLDRLVRAGATVVVVEHNTDIIRAADWAVDLGPGAGPAGGRLLYAGPPDGLLDAPGSLTGQALRDEGVSGRVGGDESGRAGEDESGRAGEDTRRGVDETDSARLPAPRSPILPSPFLPLSRSPTLPLPHSPSALPVPTTSKGWMSISRKASSRSSPAFPAQANRAWWATCWRPKPAAASWRCSRCTSGKARMRGRKRLSRA